MADLRAQLNLIPPVTRVLLISCLAVTLPLILGPTSGSWVFFSWPRISANWELWRLISPFFFAGKGIPLLFNLFILYRNSTFLESTLFRGNTADYIWCLIVTGALIIATNIPLGSYILFHPLSSVLLYLWSRASPYSSISFFGFVTIPAPYAPYAMLGLDLVQAGIPTALQGLTGIAAGYAWWWFREEKGLGEHTADTPAWIDTALRLLNTGAARASQGVQYGQTLGDRREDTGSTTGYQWGTGQRLGT
ncbi:DER1-domain-containing protein [Atractiella rhizophila]|nr:DER1-domain-containing protein [Atractiella rhizophila]